MNQTATPPVMTEEYKRGVRDACELLKDAKLTEREISTGVSWSHDFPQSQATYIEQILCPQTAGPS